MFNILQQISTFLAVASMDFNINMAFYIVLKKKIRLVITILRHVKMVVCHLADNNMTLGRHSLFRWQRPKFYR